MTETTDHTDPDGLARRVARLEDCESARNLLHAYAESLDTPVPDAVGALFTEDGSLTVPSGTWHGRSGVADFYRDRFAADPSDKRHFITSPRTTWLAPGLVEVASYFVFTGRAPERSVIGWGTYLDRIRVEGGTAWFESKTITPHVGTDLDAGWPAVPAE